MPDKEIKPVGQLRPFGSSEGQEISPVGELKPFTPQDDFYSTAMRGLENESMDTDRYQKIESVVNNLPGINDGRADVEERKEVLRQLALKNAPYPVIRQAMDVLTGKDPKQQGANNYKYYVREDGVPIALSPGERPPQGYNVASLWGTKKAAEDDNFFTSAAKHVWNGMTRGAEGFADLGNLATIAITGSESENLNSIKNAAEYLRIPTKSSENESIYKGEGFKDILDPSKYEFNTNNVTGNILQGLESVVAFTLGTKGFSSLAKGAKAIKGGQEALELTKWQARATAAAGAYNMAVGEMMDVASEAGLEGRNKAAFASVAAVPQAILESAFGAEGFVSDLMSKNPVAKAEMNQLIRTVIGGIEKDAAGNITKEGLEQLNREMTVVTSSFMKKYLGNVAKSIGEEAITEPAQGFMANASKKLYNTLVEDKFKDADLFSPKAITQYVNESIAGALGSFGPSTVMSAPATTQEIAQQRDEAQSKTIFNAVSKGNDSVSALKTNVINAFRDGEISQEEYNNAITRINAYKDYNDIITSNELSLDDGKKLEVFEKSFQKQNLEAQMEAMGKPESMNPIILAEYKAKEKMANDIQKDINEIVVSSRVNNETVAGKKTIKDVQKSIETEGEVSKPTEGKKPNIDPRLQALFDRFGKKDVGIKIEEGKRYEDVSVVKYNDSKFNARDKHSITAEYVSRQPDKKVQGVIAERTFPAPKKSNPNELNTVYGFEMPDGKIIRFASSMEREEGGFRGHTMEERLRGSEAVGTPVGMKYVWLEGDGKVPAKPALKIFHGKTGKFLGWAKSTNSGKKQEFSPKQIDALEHEQTIDETPFDYGAEVTQPTPIAPQTGGQENIVVEEPKKPVSGPLQKIREALSSILKPNEQTEATDTPSTEGGDNTGNIQTVDPNAPKEDEGRKAARERKEAFDKELSEIKRNINIINDTPLRERGQPEYRDFINQLINRVQQIGYSIGFTKKRNIQLFDEKGRRVMTKSKASPRSRDVIEEEKRLKKIEDDALSMTPMSIEHAIAMDVANGVMFSRKEMIRATGENKLNTFIFSNSKKVKTAEFYWIDLVDAGLFTQEYAEANQDQIKQQVIDALARYGDTNGRSLAKLDAIEDYERMNNNGMTVLEANELARQLEHLEKLQTESDAVIEATNQGEMDAFESAYNELSELPDDVLNEMANNQEMFNEWYDTIRGGREYFIKKNLEKLSKSDALKDVESTAKALDDVDNEKILSTIKTFSINGLKNFYHASNNKRNGRLNKNNAPQFGTGIYFSSNKDLVKNEFGENVTNVILNLSSPVFTNTSQWNEVSVMAIKLADADYGKRKNLKLSEDDTFFKYNPNDLSEIDEIPSKFISDAAQQLGHDAIVDKNSNTYENEIVVLDDSKIIYNEDVPVFISEAYHKAKKDGSNPELVKSVEELLGGQKVNKDDEAYLRQYFYEEYDRLTREGGYLQKKSDYKDNVEKIQKVIDVVKKNFKGFEVKLDTKMPYAGKLLGKTITINPIYAGADTPIHEGGHILIDLLGYDNQAIQAAIKQLKNTDLWNETAERYPELSPEMLAKEVLAEAIGREGAGIFKTESEKSAFKSFLSYIFDLIKRKLGLEKNVAKTLARQVISGRGISLPTETSKDKTIYFQMPNGERVNGKEIDKDVVNGFYSPLEKIISSSKQDKMPAKQWLEKFARGEEAKWTGLQNWLSQQQGSVSKSDIQNYLKDNRIQVVEINNKQKTGSKYSEKFDSIINTLKERGYDVSVYNYGGLNMSVGTVDTGSVYLGTGRYYYPKEDLIRDGYTVKDTYDEDVKLLEEAEELAEKISSSASFSNVKYSDYQLGGNKSDYREILVTMPSRVKFANKWSFYESKGYDKEAFYKLPEDKQRNLFFEFRAEDKKQRESSVADFNSSHWDEPNILVHLRMNIREDVDGNKVLFLEEVQSDWGQEGKKKGFASNEKQKIKVSSIKEEVEYERMGYYILTEANGDTFAVKDANKGIPTAPFVTDTNAWTKLGLKIALKEAVKDGVDKIAWTTGEQQNDRYDLSKQVDDLRVKRNEDGSYKINGAKDGVNVFSENSVKADKLPDMIGKDIAEKIINDSSNVGKFVSYKGQDLKIGGKGMKGFYGQPSDGNEGIIGGVAKSLVKELTGAKGQIVETKLEDSTQHSIELTPELISAVAGGLPMFQKVNKEVADKFAKSAEYLSKIKETEGSTKKRKLKEEREEFLDKNPDIRYIENNIRSVVRQLENKGLVITKGDCF